MKTETATSKHTQLSTAEAAYFRSIKANSLPAVVDTRTDTHTLLQKDALVGASLSVQID